MIIGNLCISESPESFWDIGREHVVRPDGSGFYRVWALGFVFDWHGCYPTFACWTHGRCLHHSTWDDVEAVEIASFKRGAE